MTESAVQSVEFSPAGSSTPDLCVYRVTRVPFFFRTVLWDPFTDRLTEQRVPRAAEGSGCSRFWESWVNSCERPSDWQSDRRGLTSIQRRSGVKAGTAVLVMTSALSLFTHEVFVFTGLPPKWTLTLCLDVSHWEVQQGDPTSVKTTVHQCVSFSVSFSSSRDDELRNSI